VVLKSFTAARHLALAIDRYQGKEREIGETVTAGDLAALALIDDLYQLLLSRRLKERSPKLLTNALDFLSRVFGRVQVEKQLHGFTELFELSATVDAVQVPPFRPVDAERRLRDLVLFYLQRRNPAARSANRALHSGFEPKRAYRRLIRALERYLDGQPGAGGHGESLLQMLLAPLRASPHSLAGQLQYILERWGGVLGEELWRIRGVLDLFAEEEAERFPPGRGRDYSLPLERLRAAEERYSLDREWMPRLILMAKNVFVWLDQLSRQYGRPIERLDQIPEEELSTLARRGFTGLWLIGVWERSRASQRIKQLRGNPEAAASAYSIKGYRIAEDLGGEAALAELESRAARCGLRLAADMVPNHMGIDSDWVIEHPERFLSLEEPPFPAYRFSGEDFSPNPDVGIYLEDHYFDGTDAAVVFKRVDRTSGETRFIYHGNDGTSTPWNDTAQLDYLRADVREAVIESILEVARRFPVIRFDAAMTLAKRHYQRLWFPEPGSAGAIPSRAGHGMSRGEFDHRMPEELWREVVDRAAQEAPDTLLLAEAFWLMEGYFVRTLGMHRVYNSAFMHMMRDRETGKYRRLIKETLVFDPEILRRYVNFMSNPDEAPASAQFGRGDRYFGVCAVMATLPGLPMFGHGQWEGLDEKYGMEYQRAYYDEREHPEVVSRHDREITPLLRQRELFAGVENFLLFDFVGPDHAVNENVLAFFNCDERRQAVVVFNNSPHRVSGSLSRSAPYRVKDSPDDRETIVTRTVWEALGIPLPLSAPIRFDDRVRSLQFLHPTAEAEEAGLTLQVEPFQCLVLTDFWLAEGDDRSYTLLAERLAGRGVPSLGQALFELRLEPLGSELTRVATESSGRGQSGAGAELPDQVASDSVDRLASRLSELLAGPPWRDSEAKDRMEESFSEKAESLLWLESTDDLPPWLAASRAAVKNLRQWMKGRFDVSYGLWTAVSLASFARVVGRREDIERWIDPLVGVSGLHGDTARRIGAVLRLSLREGWLEIAPPPGPVELSETVERWRVDEDARFLLGCHQVEEVEWLVREALEELLHWRFALAATAWFGDRPSEDEVETAHALMGFELAGRRLLASVERAGYRVAEWAEDLQFRQTRSGAPVAGPSSKPR
jgi:glycosidase